MRLRKQAFLGMVDQGVVSLTNATVALFLIQHTTKQSYGLYVTGYAVMLLAVGAINALVVGQMTIRASEKPPESQDSYCLAMFIGAYAVAVPLAALCTAIAWLLVGLDWLSARQATYIATISIMALSTLLLEYLRRLYYLRFIPQAALGMDIGFFVAVITMLYAL